ncbi:hypothetical protein GCK72_023762 [Caenorhabditis remanei]|uniref:Uncharacterized protein n=1 Tax=Caenorhabditis remanei TaxID=31234 RepID=A0A6A5FXC3_CAERE|nr:hypothetical protein GCK72_023762 [Caenorhabditis remanei]KAF1747300.1 hypothetical protein GCK72_023762 [Caenorhabditis remanei]
MEHIPDVVWDNEHGGLEKKHEWHPSIVVDVTVSSSLIRDFSSIWHKVGVLNEAEIMHVAIPTAGKLSRCPTFDRLSEVLLAGDGQCHGDQNKWSKPGVDSVDYFEHIVDSSTNHLIRSVVECDCSLLVFVDVGLHWLFSSEIVHTTSSIVACRSNKSDTTARWMNGIDKVGVTLEVSGTSSSFHVPETDALVSAAGDQVSRISAELDIHDGSSVSFDSGKVLAFSVDVPEENLKV